MPRKKRKSTTFSAPQRQKRPKMKERRRCNSTALQSRGRLKTYEMSVLMRVCPCLKKRRTLLGTSRFYMRSQRGGQPICLCSHSIRLGFPKIGGSRSRKRGLQEIGSSTIFLRRETKGLSLVTSLNRKSRMRWRDVHSSQKFMPFQCLLALHFNPMGLPPLFFSQTRTVISISLLAWETLLLRFHQE